jgi:hypothetical protein
LAPRVPGWAMGSAIGSSVSPPDVGVAWTEPLRARPCGSAAVRRGARGLAELAEHAGGAARPDGELCCTAMRRVAASGWARHVVEVDEERHEAHVRVDAAPVEVRVVPASPRPPAPPPLGVLRVPWRVPVRPRRPQWEYSEYPGASPSARAAPKGSTQSTPAPPLTRRAASPPAIIAIAAPSGAVRAAAVRRMPPERMHIGGRRVMHGPGRVSGECVQCVRACACVCVCVCVFLFL